MVTQSAVNVNRKVAREQSSIHVSVRVFVILCLCLKRRSLEACAPGMDQVLSDWSNPVVPFPCNMMGNRRGPKGGGSFSLQWVNHITFRTPPTLMIERKQRREAEGQLSMKCMKRSLRIYEDLGKIEEYIKTERVRCLERV